MIWHPSQMASTAWNVTLTFLGLWSSFFIRYRKEACSPFTMCIPQKGLFGKAAKPVIHCLEIRKTEPLNHHVCAERISVWKHFHIASKWNQSSQGTNWERQEKWMYTPWKLTWNLKNHPLFEKDNYLPNMRFGFHVSFWGCIDKMFVSFSFLWNPSLLTFNRVMKTGRFSAKLRRLMHVTPHWGDNELGGRNKHWEDPNKVRAILGGGFNYFLFSPLLILGEMIQLD